MCWGSNSDGQSSPPEGSFTAITAGQGHTCGLKTDGSALCWGDDYSGQSSPPADLFTTIAAGEHHTCGLKMDGSAVCWGGDYSGQSSPEPGLFTALEAGNKHTCGLKLNGSAVCWGANIFGQSIPPEEGGEIESEGMCGDGSCSNGEGSDSCPEDCGTISSTAIGAGHYHTCSLKTDGSALCWGDDEFGQSSPPEGSFAAITAGYIHSCGLRPNGSAVCWGNDETGQSSPSCGRIYGNHVRQSPCLRPETKRQRRVLGEIITTAKPTLLQVH